jgi:hypothetical protein
VNVVEERYRCHPNLIDPPEIRGAPATLTGRAEGGCRSLRGATPEEATPLDRSSYPV